MSDTTITRYAEPLYYFFLRKTSQTADAEDLAADVLLELLAARREHREITHLHAWVWRVAHNRYAAWAKANQRRGLREAAEDDAALQPDDADLQLDVIRREELAHLRRELAFIRRDHRELLVAHYIQDRSIADIARSLSVPEGTVKARLHRCRQMLREGMNMARKFGPRSYRPESMDFVTSGNMPSALPNSAMRRKLPLNILLEASENPSTIGELAMALGVSAPYMEEEVQLLVDATLMKRIGDKYVTDFYIMDGGTAKLLRKVLRVDSARRTSVVKQIALSLVEMVRQLHPAHAAMSDNFILWWLLPWVHEAAMFTDPHYVSEFPERSCGKNETWGIEGFEKVENPEWERCFMGRCVNCNGRDAVGLYQYDHDNEDMWDRAGYMDGQQAALLGSLLRGNRAVSSLTDTERGRWRAIEGRFVHEAADRAVPDMIVLTEEGLNRMRSAIRGHARFPELQDVVAADFRRLLDVLSAHSSSVLHAQLDYVASNEICNSRMMVINDCLADGTLHLPDDPAHSTVGMWIELR